jgi:hypothetical protein
MFSATLLFFVLHHPPGPAWREETNPCSHSFYFENDLFMGTDTNYTNGIKYVLIYPDLSPSMGTSIRGISPPVIRELLLKSILRYDQNHCQLT